MTCRFYDTRGGGVSLALLEIPKSIYILPYPWMYLSEPRLTCRVPGFTGVSASLLMLGTVRGTRKELDMDYIQYRPVVEEL